MEYQCFRDQVWQQFFGCYPSKTDTPQTFLRTFADPLKSTVFGCYPSKTDTPQRVANCSKYVEIVTFLAPEDPLRIHGNNKVFVYPCRDSNRCGPFGGPFQKQWKNKGRKPNFGAENGHLAYIYIRQIEGVRNSGKRNVLGAFPVRKNQEKNNGF